MEAAKKMKVSLPTWKVWENGVSLPNDEHMSRLQKVTGVTRTQLEAARG
jgi:ribosome-binding protein aMBF1 (putative translation factor)